MQLDGLEGWFLIGVEENLSSKVGVKYSFIQDACAWHNKILSKFDSHLTTWSKWSHPLPAVYYTIPNNHIKIPTPVKRKVAFIVQQSLSIQKKKKIVQQSLSKPNSHLIDFL